MFDYEKGYLHGLVDGIKHQLDKMEIDRVVFSAPATIVFWKDKTKTVVKCQNGEPYDPEKGLAMAFIKKFCGNKGGYYEMFKTFVSEECEKQCEDCENSSTEDGENK